MLVIYPLNITLLTYLQCVALTASRFSSNVIKLTCLKQKNSKKMKF